MIFFKGEKHSLFRFLSFIRTWPKKRDFKNNFLSLISWVESGYIWCLYHSDIFFTVKDSWILTSHPPLFFS